MFVKSKMSSAVIAAMASTLMLSNPTAAQTSADEDIEEVVVTGIAASLGRSIDIKRNSNLVSDSISAEDLGKFPDNNIADSLQRIPGVSIDRSGGEGRFVSIRGLGADFSAVLVNGRTPASENEDRAFSFDTLASELVRTVDVFKTSNAGLKEGGLGGTINIVTARPFDFEGFHAAGSLKGMYEENSGDTRPQGSVIVSNTFNDNKFGVLASLTYQERSSAKNSVENEFIIDTDTEPFLSFTNPSQNWGGGYAYSGDGLEEDTYRIQSLYAGITDETRKRVGGNIVLQMQATDNLVLTADLIHSKYDTSTVRYSTGSYLWAPTLSPLNEVDSNGFYNVINHGYDAGYNITGYAHLLTTTERPTESNVGGLNAAWDISEEWKLIADISVSTAIHDNRGLDRLSIVEFMDRPGFLLYSNGGIPTFEYADPAAIKPEMGSDNMKDLRARINSDSGVYNNARNEEFKVDVEWAPTDSYLTSLKFGANHNLAEKTTEYWQTPDLIRRMYHSLASQQEIDYNSIISGVRKSGNLFDGLNADVYMIDIDAYRTWMAENLDGRNRANTPLGEASKQAFLDNGSSWDAEKSHDSSKIEEEITSFYIDGSLDTEVFAMPLHVTGGLRYTHTDVLSSGTTQLLVGLEREPAQPGRPQSPDLVQHFADEAGTAVTVENDYHNWLPSLNARLEVTDDFYVRAAFSETLTRPTLTALSPYTRYNRSTTSVRTALGNNPHLKPFVSQNLDLSFEYYYGDSNLFAIALYQKDIDDYIVTMNLPETFEGLTIEDPSWAEFMVSRPQNGESATIEGLEINWAHVFDSGFGFSANYTFVNTNASLSAAGATTTFALPGISDTGNATAFYDKDGLQLRVAYNYRTEFLARASYGPSSEPVYYDSYGAIDISASYDIDDRFTVFLEGSNVTGETVSKYGRFKNQFIGYEDTGALYTFGVRAKL